MPMLLALESCLQRWMIGLAAHPSPLHLRH